MTYGGFRLSAIALGATALVSLIPLSSANAARPGAAVHRHAMAGPTLHHGPVGTAVHRPTIAAIHHPVMRPTHVIHQTFARGGHVFAVSRHHPVGRYAVSRRYGYGVRGATVAGGVAGYGYAYPYYSSGYSSGYGYYSSGYAYAHSYRHHRSCWWYRHYDPYDVPSWCTTYYGYSYGPRYGYSYSYEVPAYGYAYRTTYGYRYGTANHFAFRGGVHRPMAVAHGVRFHGPAAHGLTVAHRGVSVGARLGGPGAHVHAHVRVP